MIFYTLIIFIVSLILEFILINLLSPIDEQNKVNLLNAIIFSLNTGVLISSIYAMLLFFVYWILKAYDEIIYKNFYRRAILLGIIVAISLFLKLIDALDYIILGGLIIIVLCTEIIVSRKR